MAGEPNTSNNNTSGTNASSYVSGGVTYVKIRNPDGSFKWVPQQRDLKTGTLPAKAPTAPATATKTTTTATKPKTTTTAKTTSTTGKIAGIDPMGLAASIVKDPSTALSPATKLSDDVKPVDPNTPGTIIDPNDPKYQMDADALAGEAQTVDDVAERDVSTYEAQQTQEDVAAEDMTAAQGEVSQEAQVDPNTGQIDLESIASGYNPDGTMNATGQALNQFAEMDLDAVDPRATSKGQLAMLQADFTGPNGEPKIPVYAQGAAREISRIASFKGMTGTAATAAMATAMMEASIQVANSDAAFYQTLTIKNLDNKQAQTMQKAAVLANMELQNADNRMAAAIQNAQAFLAMDMKNLDNDQQARVINNQNRVQSILEDAKSTNAQRLFTANAENEMGMFYDNLNAAIQQYNATATNDMTKFNSELENNREQFYKSMQFGIDTANAKWRQDVTLHNSNQQFNAAALDVKNAVDITTEALNQLWDRSDAMLDYIWKGAESEKDRKLQLAIANLEANTKIKLGQMTSDDADKAGLGEIFGTVLGNITGSDKFLDWIGF